MRLHTICTTALLLLAGALQAQEARWEAGFLAGLTGYQGELTATVFPELDETGQRFGLLARYHLHPEWALRSTLVYASVRGDDLPAFENRDFSFTATFGSGVLALEWEPWGSRRYPAPYDFRPRLSPYGYIGGGYIRHSAEADFAQRDPERRQLEIAADKAHTYPQSGFLMTVGGGVKADLSRRAVLGLEVRNATAFSDLIDGISQAGNPETPDWLPAAQLTLTFRFLPKDQDKDGIADEDDACPQIKGSWSAFGCPDEDGDGVEDLEDLCLGEPGLPRLNGCPDRDLDGIADREDRCPDQPGHQKTMGCPDGDADGLADAEDACPKLPGPVGQQGCPVLDADADGHLQDEAAICQKAPALIKLEAANQSNRAWYEMLKLYHLQPPPPERLDLTLPAPPAVDAPLIFSF